jgi:hypothetical protein
MGVKEIVEAAELPLEGGVCREVKESKKGQRSSAKSASS